MGTGDVGANVREVMKKCCTSGERREGRATCGGKTVLLNWPMLNHDDCDSQIEIPNSQIYKFGAGCCVISLIRSG